MVRMGKKYSVIHLFRCSARETENDLPGTRRTGIRRRELVAKNVPTRIIIMIGVPYGEILKVVDAEKADLVINKLKG